MAKKKRTKKSKWERNRANVERAQERAKAAIAEIEAQGLSVSEAIKNLVYRPLKTTRYTEKQAKTYMGLVGVRSIKADAKRQKVTKYQMPYEGVTNEGRYREAITYRVGHEHEDTARALYKHMKYAINYRPSRDLSRSLYGIVKELKDYDKTLTKVRISKRNMDKFINSIGYDKFIEIYTKYMENVKDTSGLDKSVKLFYETGRTSKKAYNEYIDIAYEKSKITFGQNHNFSKSTIDKIFTFFKNSKVWSDFQKKIKDSDQYDDLFDEINNSDLSIDEIDRILMSNNSVDDVLREMRGK